MCLFPKGHCFKVPFYLWFENHLFCFGRSFRTTWTLLSGGSNKGEYVCKTLAMAFRRWCPGPPVGGSGGLIRHSCGTGIHTCFLGMDPREGWRLSGTFLAHFVFPVESQGFILQSGECFAVGKAEWNFASRYLTKSSEKEPFAQLLYWSQSYVGDTLI